MLSYLVAIATLTALIVVHEAGHMLAARLCGMRVERFSIFFGPSLLRWRLGQTQFQLGSIPFGGYVQIAGMNPHEQRPADDTGSYANKPAWQRFAAVLAGPAINYLFAILLMLLIALAWGLPAPRVGVAKVAPGTPAADAGLKTGDIIVAVDGAPIHRQERVITQVTKSGGRALRFEIERGNGRLTLQVTPRREPDSPYRIGIQLAQHPGFVPVDATTALKTSLAYPLAISAEVLGFLKQLFTHQVSPSQIGGPVEIVHQIKGSLELGWVILLLFAAKLNVLLGIFNLLPLPALDGGRLIFLGIEIVTRRRVNERVEHLVHTAGFILLLALIALVTLGDIRRRLG